MTEHIKRDEAIAALNKVRDDQRVFKYATASDFLSARDAIEKAVKVLESLPAADVEPVQEWISVDERLPENFISVLGYMTDAGEFPPVRECYTVGNAFFFPALGDVHPVSHWREMPEPPKGE